MILSSGGALSKARGNRLGVVGAEEPDGYTWPQPCAPVSTIVATRSGSHREGSAALDLRARAVRRGVEQEDNVAGLPGSFRSVDHRRTGCHGFRLRNPCSEAEARTARVPKTEPVAPT